MDPAQAQPRRGRKGLAQYFTPPLIVQFMFDMVEALSAFAGGHPRVVDPACGAGAFLHHALERGFTTPERLFGVEHDEAMRAAWEQTGLLEAIGDHLYIQDGLCDTPDGEVSADEFDVVIGNPPFGLPAGDTFDHPGVHAVYRRLTLWRPRRQLAQSQSSSLPAGPLTPSDRRRLARFPIEILFLERFVELARPGGQIAIILPDGIFSNARHQFVRDWAQQRCRLQAVVSLPAKTFGGARTAAKTGILFCRKRTPDDHLDGRVLLAAVESVTSREDFAPVLAAV